MAIPVFLLVFTLTILLQQWLHRHIQGFALALTGNPGCGIRVLFYVLLPGVVLHEASHYVVAKLLLVRASGFNVGISHSNRRQISLGSVDIQRSDPIRESLVGVAPFVVGVLALTLIAGLGFGIWPDTGLTVPQMIQRVSDHAREWTTWLELYLVFAVSTAMIPSESDREPWGPVISIFGLAVALLFLMGWTPRIPQEVMVRARQVLDALTLALGIAVIVNGAVAAVLWMLERTVAQVRGRRVEYRMRRRR